MLLQQSFVRLHRLILLGLSGIVTFSLTACYSVGELSTKSVPASEQQSATNCRTIEHDAGSTEICGIPQRVVALDPHAMDLLLSLGVQPIGYAEVEAALLKPLNLGAPMQVKYLGERIRESPIYVGTRNQPSLEAILNLKPDLIVGESASQFSHETLSRLAPTVLLLGTEADQWQNNIQRLAKAFSAEAKAQDVITNHNQMIAKVQAELSPITAQKRALLLASNGESFEAFHADQDYAGALLRKIGIRLISIERTFSLKEQDYPSFSLEILPQLKSDLIFVMTSSDNTVAAEQARWQQNPILRSLPAYQNGQVYFVDYQLWSRIRGAIAAELIVEQVRHFLLENGNE